MAAMRSVCLRGFSLTSMGLIRTQGPVCSRGQGSGQPPRTVSQCPLAENSQSLPSLSAASPCDPPSLPQLFPQLCLESFQPVKILKRIPRGARQQCLSRFFAIIDKVMNSNSVAAWEHLLHFPTRCLRAP